MEIQLGATHLELLPSRAVYLPKSQTIVVADLHLGKSATFRKRGLAVPEGSNAADLARLTQILGSRPTKKLVIAGDLFHSADGLSKNTTDSFHAWLEQIAQPVILTEGNHDRRSWFSRHKFAIEVLPKLQIDELVITHEPDDLPSEQAGIAGHLHPGVRIKESPRQSLRIAGFFVKNSQHLILPAFSEFTGIQPLRATPDDQFYAEIKGRISQIPASLIRP